ncbi:MAG: proton-conducting transporter membrane subunit [Lachnospiraceae bacterium]|nr:proton-conducting transporter membrane subunit [Lachnospiraceae bacterium]
MSFVHNFPGFSIVLCMAAGIISTPMKGKHARRVTMAVVTLVFLASLASLSYVLKNGEPFIYTMGKFPAPWGNEIRAGVLETLLAAFFSLIMLLSLAGGMDHVFQDVKEEKINLYFILIDLLLSSLLAIIYTNDLFTGYVFVEINTIAACGLIMIRERGRSLIAAIRYMIMSSIGSGLLLLGLAMLYGFTGHLLMQPAHEAIVAVEQANGGALTVPILITISVITVGLAIKSGLYPFHSWMPDAYGYSTISSSSILSSLVSKSYIVFLIKFFYRVVGIDGIRDSGILNILFVLGLTGMILGSVGAIRANDIYRMIAYSSIAQIGYVYMGIGLGTALGMTAAVFHILTHASTKSLLFLSTKGLTDVSRNQRRFHYLQGAAFRDSFSGVAFLIGSLSMVGVPMLAGFISKILFASASLDAGAARTLSTLIVLAISTILNAVYFLHTVIRIYTPVQIPEEVKDKKSRTGLAAKAALLVLILINFGLGLFSQPVTDLIQMGLGMFS